MDDRIVNLPAARAGAACACRAASACWASTISRDEVAEHLHAPGAVAQYPGRDVVVVEPPSYRFDLFIEEDLIEEIARIHGFERIRRPCRPWPWPRCACRRKRGAARTPCAAAWPRWTTRRSSTSASSKPIGNATSRGNADPIKLLNPIASQLAVMRSSLLGGLVANIVHNANRKQSRVRVFRTRPGVLPRCGDAGWRTGCRRGAPAFDAGGRGLGPACGRTVGHADAPGRFLRRQNAMCRRCSARAAAICVSMPAAHPRLASRTRAPACRWTAAPSAGWVNCIRAGRQKAELAHAPVLFEVDVQAVLDAACCRSASCHVGPVGRARSVTVSGCRTVRARPCVDTIAQPHRATPSCIVQDAKLFDVCGKAASGDSSANEKACFPLLAQDTDATLDEARVADYLGRLRGQAGPGPRHAMTRLTRAGQERLRAYILEPRNDQGQELTGLQFEQSGLQTSARPGHRRHLSRGNPRMLARGDAVKLSGFGNFQIAREAALTWA